MTQDGSSDYNFWRTRRSRTAVTIAAAKTSPAEKPAKAKKPEKIFTNPTIHRRYSGIRFVPWPAPLCDTINVRILGRKNLPAKGPFIVASNHLS